MGFKIDYFYHQEISKGEYDKSQKKQAEIVVGSPYEDVSLDIVAGKVMSLMARRNILVVDVNIYEIIKKQITFKEVDDGILIKNRKFKFDDGSVVCGEAVVENAQEKLANILSENPELAGLISQIQNPPPVKPTVQPHELIAKNQSAQPPNLANVNQKPLRYEIFDPEDVFWLNQARQVIQDFAFTKGKKYPIYEERKLPVIAKIAGSDVGGIGYVTIDDKGRKQCVVDKLFTIIPKLIEGEGSRSSGLSDDTLSWNGVINDNAPDLRRR